MGALLQFAFEFRSETCCNCGMSFAMPIDFYKRKREDHSSFYCPAGHSQYYTGESEEQKLRRELELEKKRTEWARQDLEVTRKRRDYLERSRAVYKGKLKHVKTRVANGVCPCCNRTFQNLMAHMKTQHPDFKNAK